MTDEELKRRIYVPNYEHWRFLGSRKYLSDRPLEVQTIENGVILPARPRDAADPFKCLGGVCDEEMNFVAGYTDVIGNAWNGNYVINSTYSIKGSDIAQSNEEVIFGGALICHFGHFITESLARMWYVIQNPDVDKKIVFLRMKVTSLQVLRSWVYKIFDLLELPEDRIIFLEEPTQFKKVLVPDQSLYFRNNYTKEFLAPYRYITERVRPTAEKKIFLSRSAEVQSMVHICNQEYFEDFYRARGFKIIYPEKLSITTQIALVSGADEVVTFLGTLSHWMLFCKPNVKFTMLTRVDESKDILQTMVRQSLINEASGADWYLVSAAMNFLYAAHGLGVCLIGSTEYWRQYVLDHYNETLPPTEVPENIADDYVKLWCLYYSGDKFLEYRIQTINAFRFKLKTMQIQIDEGRKALCYKTHLANTGWLPEELENNVSGLPNHQLSVQALKIYFYEPFCDVYYSVYYPSGGWTQEVSNKETAGTVGQNKAIYGLRVRLSDDNFDVCYRLHGFDGDWSAWGRNGEKLILSEMINAIQVKVVPRGADAGEE